MFPFQQLPLYKKSQQFYVNCRYLLSDIKVEKYIHDQLGRASYSIVLNIAEGSAKVYNADRRNYFTVARGSVFECVAILDLLLLEQIVDQKKHGELLSQADEISRLLYSMIRNLYP